METTITGKLEQMAFALQDANARELKSLGNSLIGEAALRNDKDAALLSVISYSLYKMLTKEHFTRDPVWKKVTQTLNSSLLQALDAAKRNDTSDFSKNLANSIEKIERVDNELSNYARNIFEKAKIKQASSAYAAGLSLKLAAELTGADSKDLQKYIGATRIHDEQPGTKNIEQRMRSLREVLGK